MERSGEGNFISNGTALIHLHRNRNNPEIEDNHQSSNSVEGMGVINNSNNIQTTLTNVETRENRSGSLKRPNEEDDLSMNVKQKPRLESGLLQEKTDSDTCKSTQNTINKENGNGANILSLSDDILLYLLTYIKKNDLPSMSNTCKRLRNIIKDKSLWKTMLIVCTDNCTPHRSFIQYMHPEIKSMIIEDPDYNWNAGKQRLLRGNNCFYGDTFQQLMESSQNLESLQIVNHVFNADDFKLMYLPKSLRYLQLKSTCVVKRESDLRFFGDINVHLPNLETLDLSYCNWFECHSLFGIAKLRSLKELILVGFRNVTDFIPYASISCSFGFLVLETLDLRFTPVADADIQCFNKIQTLKHLYLERPALTDHLGPLITDNGLTTLGQYMVSYNGGRADIRALALPHDIHQCIRLETLVARNYPRVTDLTLRHAERCMKSLKHLDITGTSCSRLQIEQFLKERPDVILLHSSFR